LLPSTAEDLLRESSRGSPAPAELQAAAKQYLPDDVYLHMTMMPRDSTCYAKRDSTTAQWQ
jgi:hypothetical protein